MLHTRAARILLASLLQTAIWLGVLVFDPFGMSTSADRGSEDIYLRLFPLFYPDENREKIQVILIKDNELPLPLSKERASGATWPLSYEDYAAVLRKVIELRPKGIFVDLFFKPDQLRPEADALRNFIAGLKPDDPPVVFADFGGGKTIAFPEIYKLPFAGARVLRGVAELEAPEHHYPLSDDKGRLSAAVALYNATVTPSKRVVVPQKKSASFLVAWGNVVADNVATDSECAPVTAAWGSRVQALASSLAAGLDTKFRSLSGEGAKAWERQQPCPYHDATGARLVLASILENVPEHTKRFRDAYVFVGAEVAGSGDRIVSPVHGQIAGVHIHAMALDNLLTYGGHPPFLSSEMAVPLQAIMIFIVALLGRLFLEGSSEPEGRIEALRVLGVRALAWFALAVTILTVLLVNHFGPNNWGGVLAIGAALIFGGAFNEFYVLVFGNHRKEQSDE